MWSNILGQNRATDELVTSISRNRLSSAYIFSGAPGVGKRMAATTLAKTVLCSDRTTTDPCGWCRHCRRIQEGLHPDVITITLKPDKSEIAIDQIRQMQSSISLHPVEGRSRIVIIDPADKMNINAANTCLKTLEEPPAKTHFILIATDSHKLLATIRSRCQQISFAPLPNAVIIQLLQERGYTENDATRITRLAQGSMGLALSLSLPLIQDVIDTLSTLLQMPSLPAMMSAAERWSTDDVEMIAILQIIQAVLRDALLHQCTNNPPSDLVDARLSLELCRKNSIMASLSAVSEALSMMERPFNRQLMMEHVLMTIFEQDLCQKAS